MPILMTRRGIACGLLVLSILVVGTWHLAWSAAGYSGTLDTKRTAKAAKPLVIGQLKSRIVSVGAPTGGLG